MLPEPQHPGDREILARWARHQKLGWRIWNTWLRPAPYLSPWRRRLGYAWRALVALALIAGAGYLVAEALASSPAYARSISSQWRRETGLPELSLSPLQWRGNTVSTESFSSSSQEGVIRSILLTSVSASAPARFGTARPTWDLGAVEARSMAIVAVPALRRADGEATLSALSRFLDCDSLTVTRSFSFEWPYGTLLASGAVWRPHIPADAWAVHGGTLDLFPLRALPVGALRLGFDGEQWQITGGTAAGAQPAARQDPPRVEVNGRYRHPSGGSLQLQARSVDLTYLLPTTVQHQFTGATDLDLALSHSPDGTHHTSAELALTGLQIHNLSFFELLATLTGRPMLRSPSFSSGSVTLEHTRDSELIIGPLRLVAEGMMTVEGSVALRGGRITATLGIGLPPEAFTTLPEWRDTVFRQGQGSLYWREFDFQGQSIEEASAAGAAQLSNLFSTLRDDRKK